MWNCDKPIKALANFVLSGNRFQLYFHLCMFDSFVFVHAVAILCMPTHWTQIVRLPREIACPKRRVPKVFGCCVLGIGHESRMDRMHRSIHYWALQWFQHLSAAARIDRCRNVSTAVAGFPSRVANGYYILECEKKSKYITYFILSMLRERWEYLRGPELSLGSSSAFNEAPGGTMSVAPIETKNRMINLQMDNIIGNN